MNAGDTVYYKNADWANRAPMTLVYISSPLALDRVAVVRWLNGGEYAANVSDLTTGRLTWKNSQ